MFAGVHDVSESVTLGVGYEANDPVNFPPVIVMSVILAAPVTDIVDGFFHTVGTPLGSNHFIVNFEGAVGVSGLPLKMVEQLLASTVWNFSFPCRAPKTVGGDRAEAPHGLDGPNFTLNEPPTVTVSWDATPPDRRGGEKVTTADPPDQAPPDGLQVTLPGRSGLALATPGFTVTRRSRGNAVTARTTSTLRIIRTSLSGQIPSVRTEETTEVRCLLLEGRTFPSQ
jgi:hypothetical protein